MIETWPRLPGITVMLQSPKWPPSNFEGNTP